MRTRYFNEQIALVILLDMTSLDKRAQPRAASKKGSILPVSTPNTPCKYILNYVLALSFLSSLFGLEDGMVPAVPKNTKKFARFGYLQVREAK